MFLKRSIFKISNLIAAGAQELVTIRVVNIVTIQATIILRAGRSDCPHAVLFDLMCAYFLFWLWLVSFSFFDLDVCLSVCQSVYIKGRVLFILYLKT